MNYNVLDLFSGIGGFSLGLERAGMRTVAFCEIDPYCQAVLRQHWPDVPVFGDVRELTFAQAHSHANGHGSHQAEMHQHGETELRNREIGDVGSVGRSLGRSIDVICGGFPCQDISVAGKGAGIDGARSGLWSEYARIIGEVRPRYVIVENVAALLGRGIERVLGDLAALGFDAEWHCIPASAVGAPHRRDRVWIIANRPSERLEGAEFQWQREQFESWASNGGCDVADAGRIEAERYRPIFGAISESDWWLAEPDVGRVADGVPLRVDRLRALGNAVVPQIAEIIGRAIVDAEHEPQ